MRHYFQYKQAVFQQIAVREFASMRTGSAGHQMRYKLQAGHTGSTRISPDGSRLAFDLVDGQETNICGVPDLRRFDPQRRRLTFRGNNRIPVWSADSRSLAFQSDHNGDLAIFRQPADVSGNAARTDHQTRSRYGPQPSQSWSRQDQLLFSAVDGATARLCVSLDQ